MKTGTRWNRSRAWWLGGLATLAVVSYAEQLALGRSCIDQPAWALIDAARTPYVDALMRAATWLGRGEVLCAVILGCVAVATRHRQRSEAAHLVFIGVGAALLSAGFKVLVARERPDLLERMVPAAGYAFPSGHSLGSAAVYGAAALWLRTRVKAPWRVWIIPAAAILVLIIGVSRAYLRVHYPSDVLAGWVTGVLWVVLAREMLAPDRRWLRLRRQRGAETDASFRVSEQRR